MARAFSLRQEFKTGLQTRVDPQLVLVSRLMELSQVELEAEIERELEENPALERLDDTPTGLTSKEILQKLGHDERSAGPRDYEAARSTPDDAVDPLDLAKAPCSLYDHLLSQLPQDDPLIEFIVYSVDERGYLAASIEEIALACETSIESVEAALAQVQACDPPGIAAVSVPDCLLRQIQNQQGPEAEVARAILGEFVEEFVARNPKPITRRLKVAPALVQQAFDLLLALDPYPASEFLADAPEARAARFRPVPELVIDRSEQGWVVTVPGAGPRDYRVNREFDREWKRLSGSRHDAASRSHLGYFLNRARRFLDAMQQRQRTLQKIGAALIQEQSGFLVTGDYQFLADLTQSRFATAAGLHESTISRATRGKFVQIPTGELVPFEVFFDGSLRIKKMIQEILACENPGDPFTDERIRQLLAQKGVNIARRTVHKYREEFKTLSSRMRRSA